jgi:uncharacterized membrane protein YraQ (UPF0718 family)
MEFISQLWNALIMAAAMAWQVGWSLVLGFSLSGLLQAVVSKDRMRAALGRDGVREIGLATAYGAASSSCSYAAAALSKTLFTKGAGFIASLAFLFSSTNLVIELGFLLYVLMGWQFTVAEWIGGLLLITILALLVKLTYPAKLIAAARAHAAGASSGHEHGDDTVAGATLWAKLRDPRTRVLIAQTAAMDWSMLRTDLMLGFLIAGMLAVFVPPGVWHIFFFTGGPPIVTLPLNAVAGAALAIVTFVCSIGNVPMAAVLWGTGVSFGGVLAFLYADLIVLPLLDVYRKYYGLRMTLYLFALFFVTIVVSATLMDVAFTALHALPVPNPNMRASIEHVGFNATFWLNLAALVVVAYFTYLNRKHPAEHGCAMHEHHGHEDVTSAPGADPHDASDTEVARPA